MKFTKYTNSIRKKLALKSNLLCRCCSVAEVNVEQFNYPAFYLSCNYVLLSAVVGITKRGNYNNTLNFD